MIHAKKLSRSGFLTLSAAVVSSAAVGGVAGTARFTHAQPAHAGEQSNSNLRIMLATDMHFISPRLTDHGTFFEQTITHSDAKCMEYSEQIVDAMVWTALREHPDALVISGDLTYNGALESHEDFANKLAQIMQAGIPVFVMPGNHDVNCDQAARFEGDSYEFVTSATADDFARIYDSFGYANALSCDDASLSYVVELEGGPADTQSSVRLLFVDCNAVDVLGTIPDSTLVWVERQLIDARDAGVAVIGISHQNLLQQAFIAESFSINNASKLQDLYEKYGVRANFSGHLHCQHYAQTESGLTDVATSSLAVCPNQYAIIEIAQTDAPKVTLSYHTEKLDVSGWAREQESGNPDLFDFESYARNFFLTTSREGFANELSAMGLSDNEVDELADYIVEVNLAWFAGRLDQFEPREDLNAKWTAASPLSGYYLKYIFHQTPVRNENVVAVEWMVDTY